MEASSFCCYADIVAPHADLREVRAGARVLVTDRDRVVAEWIDAGVVSLPTVRKTGPATSPLRLDEGTAERLLEVGRDETGR